MSAELWPCSECGAAGVLNLGTSGHCTTHASELLRTFDPSSFQMRGRWVQVGCSRPDHGPSFAECECPCCGATAVALVGSPCAYCELSLERMARWQADKLLTPPDDHRPEILKAWAKRLAVAVQAEIITADEARSAWHREVSDERRSA
jgi:hypothetical protein